MKEAHERYLKIRPFTRPDATRPPVTVLVAGVPGAGKSTLAEALAWEMKAPVYSIDWVFGALRPFEVVTDENAEPLADVSITALMARQLQLGLDVIIDAPGHRVEIRNQWREITEGLGGTFVGVECVCSDPVKHRERVEGRVRGIPGWHSTVPWEHVLRMKGLWEDWEEPHLVLDSAVHQPAESVRQVLAYL